MNEGLFDRFPWDLMFGIHNDPTLPVGTIQAVAGIVCANADEFTININAGAVTRRGHNSRSTRS